MLFYQVCRWVCNEPPVTTADQNDGIYPDGFHVFEITAPFFDAPVLVGNVVADLI
jgi:hypothetical protein